VQLNGGTPISTAAITTTTDETMVVHVFGSQDDNSWGTYGGPATTARITQTNTNGNDNSLYLTEGTQATAGSSAAATATQTALGPDAGVSVLLALKIEPDYPILLTASTYIGASGSNTAPQMTPPTGKTTAVFGDGRIQDDENPADSVNIDEDEYTEFEWCLEATSEATVGDVYQFRLTDNGTLLDTYAITPEWTIIESPLKKMYRSVGPSNTSDLIQGTDSGGIDLTITAESATFGSALPSNVGVGDAIEFDSDDDGTVDTICFIHALTDSTTCFVRDAAGGEVTATIADDQDWAIYRAYTSLSNAESGIENTGINLTLRNFDDWTAGGTAATDDVGRDLVANNEQWNIACYADADDTTAVTINSWTTGTNTYLSIFAPYDTDEVGTTQRHDGTTGNGYFLTTGALEAITIQDNYVRIEGIEASSNSNIINVNTIAAANDIRVSYCLLHDTVAVGSEGIYCADTDIILRAWNNILYDIDLNGIQARSTNLSDAYIYNNTISDCGSDGIQTNGSVCVAINNLIANCGGTNYNGTFNASSDYNWSDDATDPGGANDINSGDAGWSDVNFADEPADDFHLDSSDTDAINGGTNLSLDGNLSFSDDIDADSRDGDGLWDIGADESVFIPATQLYRSVGPERTTYLTSSGCTLDISGTTATFGDAMPNNVGVGDAIQYDTDGGAVDAICFIAGRTSSTVFTVQAADGSTPTATAAETTWDIFRAYISLSNWESHTENTGIAAGLRDFDTAANRSDLVTDNTIMNVACYANGTTADGSNLNVSSWTTGTNNYIKIYTPYQTSEVGESQRHNGKWDDEAYKLENNWTILTINADYIKVEGLQIKATAGGDYVYGMDINDDDHHRNIAQYHSRCSRWDRR